MDGTYLSNGTFLSESRPPTLGRRTFLAATLAVATSACGFSGSEGEGTGEGGGSTSTLKISMTPVTNLDPAVSGNASNGQIIMAGLWEGLVLHDQDDPMEVVGGVAESWDVSEDELTYTFHLRSDARWSNGDTVTAEDIVWNWKRTLTPGMSGEETPSYNQNQMGIVGAGDYLSGTATDFETVGVKAPDDATVEFTLEAPNSNFLLEMANYQCLPLHPATVEELGDHEWLTPEGWVSNGAYVLSEFKVNQRAVLVPNENYWDAGNYHIDRFEILFNDGGTTADVLSYQNGEIDISGRIEDDLEAVTSSDVAGELVSTQTNQIRQLIVMNSVNTTLHDVRVRKAMALAIDREALGELSKPAVPGNSMLPDMVPGADQVPGISLDVDAAKALLAEAGYPDAEGMPTITLLDYQSNPWVEAISQMWQENLGLKVTIDMVERGVFLEKRLELHPKDYVGFYAINTSVSPPTLRTAAQRILPAAPSAGVFGLNLVPPKVAKEFLDAQAGGAAPAELLKILEGQRYAEAAEALKLAAEGLAETDEAASDRLLIESAIARDESCTELAVLWGGYNLLVKPKIKNFKPWPYTSVFITKGVTIEG